MQIHKNFSLKKYNTFGIEAKAGQFVSVQSVDELITVLNENPTTKKFILGGGSNMLLTQDIDALVIHLDLKGKKIIDENDDFVWVESQAGENWHEFVIWTINQNFGGLENLSLIPGNVGTTPIQNIGAYGVEIKDTFVLCEAIHIETQELMIFTNEKCKFNTSYGAIETELEKQHITNPTLKDVSDAVISIRQSKLPDPKELGNSGSFFKNPVILKTDFEKIQQKFPEMQVKVPAGWLIEQAGFKGKRFGDAGIHKNQALVLVNYGKATGQEILAVAKDIQATIQTTFSILIETEVNII